MTAEITEEYKTLYAETYKLGASVTFNFVNAESATYESYTRGYLKGFEINFRKKIC